MVFARRSSSIAAALLAVLGLCGCVAQEPVAAASSSSAPVFDRNEPWAPYQNITLPPMTMEQKLEFRQQWLDAEVEVTHNLVLPPGFPCPHQQGEVESTVA